MDKVVERLLKAHEEIPIPVVLLETEPKWDEVRGDRRFVELVKKLGSYKGGEGQGTLSAR